MGERQQAPRPGELTPEGHRARRHRARLAAAHDYAPPAPPPLAVRRTRLLRLLDLAAQQPVTFVTAPPGYGKTVVLAQWASEVRGTRVRWLTLLPEHDDEPALVRDLLGALGRPATRRSDEADPRPPPRSLAELAGELDGMVPTTLVIDDFHLQSDPAVLDDLASLFERAPRALHVVVATRVDPPLPAYRLRLAGALVELRRQDLAFTPAEASELLRHVSRRELDDAQVAAVVSRTEGWAAALQLVALSLRDRPDIGPFVEAFVDDDSRAADYLTEEVLRRQPEAVRRFLLATSVLDPMSGPLCDFVTGVPGGQAQLEELDRTSMFITPVGGRHRWYRYHKLFRALLRHHLRDTNPELERELLRRAAEWHLDRDEVEAGLTYLADLGAWDDVLEVIFTHGAEQLAHGDVATVVRWIERVPAAVRRRRPTSLLLEAAALLTGGDGARVTAVIESIDAIPTLPPGDRLVGNLLRALHALQHGELGQAMAAADRVLRDVQLLDDTELPHILDLIRDRADIEAGAMLVRGVCLFYGGHVAEGRRTLQAVLDTGHPTWQISALGTLAHLEARAGRLSASERLAARALALADELGTDQQRITADTFLALAHVAIERDQLDRAAQLLDSAGRRWGPNPRAAAATLLAVEQALLALARGEPAVGLALLAGRRSGDNAPRLWVMQATRQWTEARLQLELGDLDAAQRAVDAPLDPEPSGLAALKVRLAVERGNPEVGRALLARWPDMSPRATQEHALWGAVLDFIEGHERASLDRLAGVVTEAELEGDLGLFRAAGRSVLGPARSLQRVAPTAFLRQIVEGASTVTPARPGAVTEIVDQLTERECTILTLIPTRLSNVEIAARLGISLNTVKTHLKHIYRKLDVVGRNEAVERAEQLGLL